ncbi:hypothetical protein E4T42_01324 [Aureobasidium subglaciale]|nr:hypothetical protein E4T42_01324 [Aureobasidium subglaciale]
MSTPKEEQAPVSLDTTTAVLIPPRSFFKATSIPSKRPPGWVCVRFVFTPTSEESLDDPQDLLIHYSDFFRGALTGSFKEAVESKISLPDERADVFEIFNHFIYTRSLADNEDHKIAWELLVETWFFGDQRLIPSLQYIAMDELTKKNNIEEETPTTQIKKFWNRTLPAAPLRKVILDLVVYKAAIDIIFYERWPQEALVDLIKTFYHKEDTAKRHSMPTRDKCYYHVHNEGQHC